MTELFITLLHMSMTASFAAAAVIIIRAFLRRAPKIFSYVIWLPVLIRLVLPFSINSRFSFMGILELSKNAWGKAAIKLIPDRFNLLTANPILQNDNAAVSGNILNKTAATAAASPGTGGLSIESNVQIAALIWLAGIAALSIYSIISYFKISRNLKTATLFKDNIFETDRISTPFVYGFLKPRIYIPTGLDETQLTCILLHEQTHIKRLDYLIKPVSFLALLLHWFNPLIWISFLLMSRDMEMSCDESVIRKLGNTAKINYSKSLLSMSVRRSGPVSPLAFGESSIKARIKNILKLTTPSFFITILITVLTAAFIIGFVTNPIRGSRGYNNQEYDIDKMLAGKTAYVGNNAKVVALIDAMPFPAGLVRETVELHTGTRPFAITINMDMREVSGILENGAISGSALFPNSVMLFSLIDNVDTIKYRLSDNTGKYDGASYGFTFSRSMPEKLLGEDVRSYSADRELLQKLLDRVTKMRVGVQKDSDSIPAGSQMKSTEYEDKETAGEIEQYLRVITAPGSSSSPEDYIRAHGKEYESILKLRNGALDYFLLQFKENRVENDLRGHIIMSLCKELLGDRNNVNDPAILPTEWYSKLKPIV